VAFFVFRRKPGRNGFSVFKFELFIGGGSMASRSEMNKKPVSDKLVPKRRKCLMCLDDFQSNHIGERVCPDCKGTSTWRQTGIAI